MMTHRLRMVCAAGVAVTLLQGCAGHLASKPGVFKSWTETFIHAGHTLELNYVKPVTPRTPPLLILFATGDAGWMGVSGDLFEHMAERGYFIAAMSSREIVGRVKRSKKLTEIPVAAAAVDGIIVEARRALGLPERTQVIVTGYSRGANLVVFAAGVQTLQHHICGAVAIALTRETDFLQAPAPVDRPPSVEVDDKGRIQTYPAIARAGSIPFAVIQSAGDSYVPAAESRRLFGPDTPTRRLYEVDARNHGFSGGRDELIHDLDDALQWIEATEAPK